MCEAEKQREIKEVSLKSENKIQKKKNRDRDGKTQEFHQQDEFCFSFV